MSRKSITLGLIATAGLFYILILHVCNIEPNFFDWLITIAIGCLFIIALTLDVRENYRDNKRNVFRRRKKQ